MNKQDLRSCSPHYKALIQLIPFLNIVFEVNVSVGLVLGIECLKYYHSAICLQWQILVFILFYSLSEILSSSSFP